MILTDGFAAVEDADTVGRAFVVAAVDGLGVVALAVADVVPAGAALGFVDEDWFEIDGPSDGAVDGPVDGPMDVPMDGETDGVRVGVAVGSLSEPDGAVDGETEGRAVDVRCAELTATTPRWWPAGLAATAKPVCRTTAAVVNDRSASDARVPRRRSIDHGVFGPSGRRSTMSSPTSSEVSTAVATGTIDSIDRSRGDLTLIKRRTSGQVRILSWRDRRFPVIHHQPNSPSSSWKTPVGSSFPIVANLSRGDAGFDRVELHFLIATTKARMVC